MTAQIDIVPVLGGQIRQLGQVVEKQNGKIAQQQQQIEALARQTLSNQEALSVAENSLQDAESRIRIGERRITEIERTNSCLTVTTVVAAVALVAVGLLAGIALL